MDFSASEHSSEQDLDLVSLIVESLTPSLLGPRLDRGDQKDH